MRNLALALWLSFALPLLLASCTLPGTGRQPENADNYQLMGEYFAHLTREYTNLADYEREQMGHDDDSAFFTAKAGEAQDHVPVAPENPARREIPDFARDEMERAHAQLQAALRSMFSPDNGPLLAIAQTRFDCWLIHQEDFPQENAHLSCRQSFYDAMAHLEVPHKKIYSVEFDSGSAGLSPESMEIVRKAAHHYRGHDSWKIELKGFADKKGNKTDNRNLSMRRALAVRNALAQQGVDFDSIIVRAEGADFGKDGDGARLVEIAFLTEDQIEADPEHGFRASGWDHAGEDYGD